eukprot:5592281-Pyramimonas_sp.AAC.1
MCYLIIGSTARSTPTRTFGRECSWSPILSSWPNFGTPDPSRSLLVAATGFVLRRSLEKFASSISTKIPS